MKAFQDNARELFAIAFFAILGVIFWTGGESHWTKFGEILTAAGIGFYSQKIASKNDIKSYVRSSFRRIRDIHKSILRIHKEIDFRNIDDSYQLKLTLARVQVYIIGLLDTTNSSMHDWVGIIGEELELIKQIDLLEKELNQKDLSPTRREELTSQIEELSASLPYEFTNTVFIRDDLIRYEDLRGDLPAPGKDVFDILKVLEETTKKNRGLRIAISRVENNIANSAEILSEATRSFFLRGEASAGNQHLAIYTDQLELIGEVDKEQTPPGIEYRTYLFALMRYLEVKQMISESDMGFFLLGAKYDGESPTARGSFFLYIPLPT